MPSKTNDIIALSLFDLHKQILILVISLVSGIAFSQNPEIDRLTDKSYEEIKQLYLKVPKDSIALKEKIAGAYIAKAKRNNDSINIARGYYYFSTMYGDPELGLAYADTILQYTKNVQHKNFPATGYFLKGYWHNEMGKYRKALSDYIKGDSIAKQRGNKEQQSYNFTVIAILKDRAGSHSEALVMYKKILDSLETIKYEKNFDNIDYLSVIYNTSNVYIKLKKNDSAKIYSRKGITESIRVEDSSFYYNFVFLEGVIAYLSGKEKNAFEGLKTSFPHIDEYLKAIAYYYMGEIYKKQANEQKAIHYFKKTDSIAMSLDYSFTELGVAYENILTYYEKKKNFKQQLKYINKTLKLDSALSQSEGLKLDLVKKYDTPILLKKKQKAIDALSRKNKLGTTTIIGLVIMAIVLVVLLFYFRRKQKSQQKKFDELVRKSNTEKKAVEIKSNGHNVPPEVYKTIAASLDKFERNKGFKKNMKLAELAKKLDTNTSYLSKVINEREGKNFSQYLKTLRINYMIEHLKTDKKTRSYTIQAIAKEAGFGTAQSFSKAFYQETGIYPSYFIKKLNDG